MNVCILTPTYNREKTLTRLYKSLINQTNKNFCWLIIDDGSTDGTEDSIRNMCKENKIKIKYYKKENGGKHTALNMAFDKIKEDLFIIVDSDDWLAEQAVEIILAYGKKYINRNDIAVISFLKQYPNGTINGPAYERDEYEGYHTIERLNKNNWGDKAEVCITNRVKKYKLPENKNEKFMSEGYFWINIGLEYKSVYVNKAIYIAEYLEDGLTKNIYKIRYSNPTGCTMEALASINHQASFKTKAKGMIKAIAYSRLANMKITSDDRICKNNTLYIFLYIPGVLFRHYVKRKGLRGNHETNN